MLPWYSAMWQKPRIDRLHKLSKYKIQIRKCKQKIKNMIQKMTQMKRKQMAKMAY
jgi:hypothetical protein